MSAERKPFIYELPGRRRPLGSVIYGVVFIALGITALVWCLAQQDAAATGTGILLCVIAGALGAWMIVVGVLRWGWYRRYIKRHGGRPF